MLFNITLVNTDERFACSEKESVLAAMEQLRRKGIPVGCRNGGCGVCKVRVIEGECSTGKCSRAVVSEQDESQGLALACKTYPRSDMKVEVVGGMARAVVARRSTSFSFEFTTTWQLIQQDKET